MQLLRWLIRESLSPHAETLTKEQLTKIAAMENGFDINPRFKRIRSGGVFNFFDPSSDLGWSQQESYFPVVRIGDEVAGLAKLQKSPYKENHAWISFISIDPKYQGMGYASPLVDELFRFAKEKGWDIEGSSRSEMGQQRLSHLIDRSAEKHGVTYLPSKDKL